MKLAYGTVVGGRVGLGLTGGAIVARRTRAGDGGQRVNRAKVARGTLGTR